MNPLVPFVEAAMTELVGVRERIDGVRVTTHCLYPTNEFVHVVVRGTERAFQVSDEGGAYRQLDASGFSARVNDGQIKHLVTSQGLILEGSAIRSPTVKQEALPMAIALVANASKEAADWFYTHLQIKRTRDFKKIVKQYLREKFDKGLKSDEVIVGKSNKPHKFENVVVLAEGKRLIVDPVLHESASMSARIVANLDVRGMGYENLEQRIVYDDEGEDWKPEDLNLLAVGAPVIPFKRSISVIDQFARP